MRKLMLVALAGIGMLAAGGQAQAKEDMVIQNRSGQSLRVTIHDVTHYELWSGCIQAGQNSTWKPNNLTLVFSGGTFWARAAYKAKSDCSGNTHYDSGYGSGHLIPAGGTATVTFQPKPVSDQPPSKRF